MIAYNVLDLVLWLAQQIHVHYIELEDLILILSDILRLPINIIYQ